MTTESTRPRTGTAGAPIVRPFRPGDETAILAIMLEVLDRGELEGVGRHQLETTAERLVHAPASCAVAEIAGQLAGWVIPVDDDLTVAPAHRRLGVGRRLVEAGRALAAADGREDLRLWVPGRPGPEAFARACGLAYHSSLWQLRLADGAPSTPPVFPDGLLVRALEPDADEAAFVDLVNDTFLDHPSPLRLTAAEVRRAHATPGFDPATILVVTPAAAPDRLVGFCRVTRYRDDAGRETGEVRLLGVRREARRHGLGRALTAWGVADLRRRGAEEIVISVEGENEAALGIYLDLGFERHVEWPHWSIPAVAIEA
jgi:mycothiol synthase